MAIVSLTLSIDVGSDPIQGTLAAVEQAPQPFHGWVELAAAIEAVRAAPAPELRPGGDRGKD